MKKNIVIIFAAIFLPLKAIIAQQITIRDASTREGIAHVIIKDNQNQQATTNANGVADVSNLNKTDSLILTQTAYFTKKFFLTTETVIFLQPKTVQLDEIVFSANRIEEKKSDVPYHIEVIDRKQIEFANQQTSADVLQNTGNVFVQKSQGGGGSPILRGFEANKVLIVLDGIRMNNAIYRGGHLQDVITLDAQMLDRTEVLFGPSSTMYGSDALGGVMHFYTKNAQFAPDDKMNIKANAMARYSSANQEKTGHVDFNIGLKKIAFLTNVTFSDYDDLRAGSVRLNGFDTLWKRMYYVERINDKDSMVKNGDPNLQVGTGYSQMDFMQRVNIKHGEFSVHGLNFQMSQSSEINRYDRLSEYAGTTLKRAENGYGPQKRMLAAYSFTNNAITKISDNIKVTAAYQKIDQDRFGRIFGSNNRTLNYEDVSVYSLNADLFKKIRDKSELRYGVEVTYNDVQSKAEKVNIVTNSVAPTQTRYPDGGSTMLTYAVYLSNSYEVDKSVVLVSGLRFNSVTVAAAWQDTLYNFKLPFKEASQNNMALTGNLGVVFKSENNWKAALFGSTGFRAPNVDDIGKVNDPPSGVVVVPNPEIKPEYAYNMEFNLSKTNANFSFEAAVFYTLLENAISLKPFTLNGQDSALLGGLMLPVQASQNYDRAYLYGINGGVKIDITNHFSVRSVINYTYGRYIDAQSEKVVPLDHIPPVFGQTNLIYKATRFEGEFFVRYNGTKKLVNYSPSGEDNLQYANAAIGMPSWFTLNLRVGYNITNNFRLTLACENMSDNHYRIFASGVSAPGRNFIVSLRYKM